MSTSTDDILKMIAGGVDPTTELQDIAQQAALARALKMRQVAPTVNSGRAVIPNFGGVIGNSIDVKNATAEEQALIDRRRQIQTQQADRAAAGVQAAIPAISGYNEVGAFEGMPAQQMAGTDRANKAEFDLLHGATDGAPAVEAQQTLRKYALEKAATQARANRAAAGGGASAFEQRLRANMAAHPEWSYDEAVSQTYADFEKFIVTDVGGVPTRVGNAPRGLPGAAGRGGPVVPAAPPIRPPAASGGTQPLSNLPTEVLAGAQKESGKAEGGVVGKIEAERAYMKEPERVMVDGMKSNAAMAIDKINRTKNDPALSRISGWMNLFSNWPGSSASDVQGRVNSINAMLGFDALQEIRAQNKTGGGVGALSDAEREALQQSVVALAQSQSDEELRRNFDILINKYQGMIQRLEAKWQAEYGDKALRVDRPTILPAAPAAPGVRRYNPETGMLE